jgi:K+-transporting ATPase ATPase C chain
MKENFLKSLRLTLVSIIFFSGIYSMIVLGYTKALVPGGGSVQLTNPSGVNTGGINIGQSFSDDKYFWGRPSAVNYDASGSAGSNKGPTNPDYLEIVKQRIDTFLVKNPGVERKDITSELVTASGSGLDPHISKQSAVIQIPRIAKARNVQESELMKLIESNTEGPDLGIFGTERINILKLNISLDESQK